MGRELGGDVGLVGVLYWVVDKERVLRRKINFIGASRAPIKTIPNQPIPKFQTCFYTGLSEEEVGYCTQKGVFMLASGRISMAGLNDNNYKTVCRVVGEAVKAK